MHIELYPPLAIHEKGQRASNEDNIYPGIDEIGAIAPGRLFMVCDGVGGEAKGEVASNLACSVMAEQLRDADPLDAAAVSNAIRLTEQTMDDYVRRFPDAQGMATTLTLLSLNREGATVAHVGDSRIYQIRRGDILFKTRDHSFVEELIANNLLAPEDAVNHPKRNVVTRAVTGSRYPADADVQTLTDIEAGDYFFLCTDGVLESISEEGLVQLLREETQSDAEKMDHIRRLCLSRSRDNFSAYLVRIREATRTGEAASANAASFLKKSVSEPRTQSLPASSSMNFFLEKAAGIAAYLRHPVVLFFISALIIAEIVWFTCSPSKEPREALSTRKMRPLVPEEEEDSTRQLRSWEELHRAFFFPAPELEFGEEPLVFLREDSLAASPAAFEKDSIRLDTVMYSDI